MICPVPKVVIANQNINFVNFDQLLYEFSSVNHYSVNLEEKITEVTFSPLIRYFWPRHIRRQPDIPKTVPNSTICSFINNIQRCEENHYQNVKYHYLDLFLNS